MIGKKKWRKNWKKCNFEKDNENLIVKMHYVGHFIV
jgi:hypothetical protein